MRTFQGQWLLSNQNMKVHLRMWSQKGMQGESLARGGGGGGNFDLQHYNKSPSLSKTFGWNQNCWSKPFEFVPKHVTGTANRSMWENRKIAKHRSILAMFSWQITLALQATLALGGHPICQGRFYGLVTQ